MTAAVTDVSYYALLNLATGELSAFPSELSGTGRPERFSSGDRAAVGTPPALPGPVRPGPGGASGQHTIALVSCPAG